MIELFTNEVSALPTPPIPRYPQFCSVAVPEGSGAGEAFSGSIRPFSCDEDARDVLSAIQAKAPMIVNSGRLQLWASLVRIADEAKANGFALTYGGGLDHHVISMNLSKSIQDKPEWRQLTLVVSPSRNSFVVTFDRETTIYPISVINDHEVVIMVVNTPISADVLAQDILEKFLFSGESTHSFGQIWSE